MPTAEQNCALYKQLAEKYHGRGRFQERDRFLILAADTAWNAGDVAKAEELRRRIMDFNPSHLLKPYATFEAALKSPDILAYVQQLRRGYPRERAMELLRELDAASKPAGMDDDQIRTYASDEGASNKPAAAPWSNPSKPAEPPKPQGKPPVIPFKQEPAPQPSAAAPEKQKVIPFQMPPAPALANDKQKIKAATPPVKDKVKDRAWPVPLETVLPPIQAGSWIGELLFTLVLVLSCLAIGYLFVWPYVRGA